MCPSFLVTLLLLQLSSLVVVLVVWAEQLPEFNVRRDDFPSNFVFGAGTSALQVEGAIAEDGKTPNIWDVDSHMGHMPDKSTTDIACDSYHRYKEDVKIMSDIGLEAYRFSIAWTRILPYGRGFINPKGVEYYNNLIDTLLEHGIQPHATIYHIDHPQILEDEYGGWLSPRMIEDFTTYADVCFREFGDRVSHWTTINEPNIISLGAYDSGQIPPHRCTPPGAYNCTAGNSSVEPYKAMHHFLLAHASAVQIYRTKYQAKQKGLIGLNVYGFWCAPQTNSRADIEATKRATAFYTGWAADPLVFGDYPIIMKENVGSRLPSFTKNESELVKGSFDFIGLNHYFVFYIQDDPEEITTPISLRNFDSDMRVKASVKPGDSGDPSGLKNLLRYFKDNYGNPPVYVHENGFGSPQNETLDDDMGRIRYISGYIGSMLEAIKNGSDTRGYFVWSFMDAFEILSGYQTRYGIVHVDFDDKSLKRQLKPSAQWYSNFIKKKNTTEDEISYSSQ
uniref:Cyanidin 3-O-glucoside 7-O-glucosyltransferase (acyl-glucose) n=1 Tax=Delphinium grandiflorum TaxID=85439 RepID=AA7GT_DELGR|nr:RecName: Full=Cyanidin 3-O-glucoside 7-O-glucosyltransferase (acyl-glucose); Short=AA7GT; Short=Dg AA7GT; AltName: Full=Acyl-glucose-dependent anthocyanin 7-O-glucosytransferase; AltName: Full=Beta-glucosidase like protein; Short=DgBGLUL; Flags: Precursor [Delphinium grandiflorum]BAJ33502.1 beta glucosidase like protein [Delphinium grandiflorum]